MTGLSLAVCSALGIKLGSYFSAGLLDLVLSYQAGEHSFWIIPLGILFFFAYTLLFYQLLERTPLSMPSKPIAKEHPRLASVVPTDPQILAIQYLKVLGGMDKPAGDERLPDPSQPASARHQPGRSIPPAGSGLTLLNRTQKAPTTTDAGPQRGTYRGADLHAGRAPFGTARSQAQ